MTLEYKPVSCSLYDALESSVLRGARVTLRFAVQNNPEERIVRVVDLISRDRQEFLVARDSETGEELVVRLDSIIGLTDLSTHT